MGLGWAPAFQSQDSGFPTSAWEQRLTPGLAGTPRVPWWHLSLVDSQFFVPKFPVQGIS